MFTNVQCDLQYKIDNTISGTDIYGIGFHNEADNLTKVLALLYVNDTLKF